MTSLTPTEVLMAAAAIWLLLVLCGAPGGRSRTTLGFENDTVAVADFEQGADIVRYTVGYQDVPEPRHVQPPLPGDDALPASETGCDSHL